MTFNQWISDPLSQGYTDFQSLVKGLVILLLFVLMQLQIHFPRMNKFALNCPDHAHACAVMQKVVSLG